MKLSRVVLVLTAAAAQAMDLTRATVVAPAAFSAREKKAVTMLVEEVEKRSQLRWPVAAQRCDTLFSEDLNAGEVIAGVRIVNPFNSRR